MKAAEVQMAKKAGNINMAEEIRNLLTQNSELTGSEVEALLRKKLPRQKINSNSCGVAYSIARTKLRLRLPPTMRSYSGDTDVNLLTAAKEFVDQCDGDVNRAITGLIQLVELQN
jgi:hypothetical protein